MTKLQTLREEYERYSELAEIEGEKVEALVKQLELTVSSSRGRDRWIALSISVIASLLVFFLGIVLSEPLTMLWNNLIASSP